MKWILCGAFLILGLGVGWGKWFKDRRGAGRFLVEAGRNPYWGHQLLVAAVCLFGAIWSAYYGLSHFDFWSVLVVVGFLLLTALCLVCALSKVQICENGVRVGGGLFRWERLEGFSWDKAGSSPLLVLLVRPGSAPMRLSVPRENQETVNRLLRQHLPDAQQRAAQDAAQGARG